MKILITSGGTKVPIDDVRSITNMSTGKYATELALNFSIQNNDVVLFRAKGSEENHVIYIDQNNKPLPYPKNIQYSTFDEYLKVTDVIRTEKPEIIISAAAVSDYTVVKTDGKISSSEDEITITLKKAPKVLPLMRAANPSAMLVGFKLLVSPKYQEIHTAVKKVLNNGADYVVYNDLTEIRKGNKSRLVFDKKMNYKVVEDVKELSEYITEQYLNREQII